MHHVRILGEGQSDAGLSRARRKGPYLIDESLE